jgi:hypothetical protein
MDAHEGGAVEDGALTAIPIASRIDRDNDDLSVRSIP